MRVNFFRHYEYADWSAILLVNLLQNPEDEKFTNAPFAAQAW